VTEKRWKWTSPEKTMGQELQESNTFSRQLPVPRKDKKSKNDRRLLGYNTIYILEKVNYTKTKQGWSESQNYKVVSKKNIWGEENILHLVCDDYTTTFVKINTIIHLKGLNFQYVNNTSVKSNSSLFPIYEQQDSFSLRPK